MFGSLGFPELLLILVIVLIIFGVGKLPKLGEGLGKALHGFRKEVQEPTPHPLVPTPAQAADAEIVSGVGHTLRTMREEAEEVRRTIDPEVRLVKAELESAQHELQASLEAMKIAPKIQAPRR